MIHHHWYLDIAQWRNLNPRNRFLGGACNDRGKKALPMTQLVERGERLSPESS
jgi:hypothetical protein